MKTLMLTTLGIVTVLGAGLLAFAQTAAKGDEAERGPKVQLQVESVPLARMLVAKLEFDIPEGWHTYWPGQNDTGSPIITTWTLPDGYTVSKPRFPSPTRHVGGGELLDYALEGKFAVLYTITPPPRGGTGIAALTPEKVPVAVQVDYLVCKEACVPHTATLQGEGTVEAHARPGCGHEAGMKEVELRRTHPVVLPEWQKWEPATTVSRPKWRWETLGRSETLIIFATKTHKAPAPKHLEFYPYEDSAELLNPITSGITDTGELKLTFKPQGKLKPGDKPKPVYGVVRVGSGPTSPTYEIKIDLPAAAKPAESSAPLPPPLPPAGNNPSTVSPAK